ncbi:hypothetical protein ACP70R_027441 [Stipagrostis hirtigluma subsp. patula]
MGYDKACRRDSCECGNLEIGKRRDDKASYDSEVEEGEFRKDKQVLLSSSVQVEVEKEVVLTRQSTSHEKGSHQEGTANNTVEQSKYSALKGHSVSMRQPHRRCSEIQRSSYSPSLQISSKERHEQRKYNCFRYWEYHYALEKIEKVYSERLGKLLLHQKEDCNKFYILRKKQQSKFFLEHVRSYKVHYERVIPTVKYRRMKLPKPSFCMLREIFNKHIRSELKKFWYRQINDRNKEKRKKERWIFEASAGYLKKNFDETSLTYSGFEMKKWDVPDYFEVEEQLKYFDMQSLTAEIKAIAYSMQVEETHKECETNESTKHGLLIDAAEEIATLNSMSSQSYPGSSEKVASQVAFSSPPQNEEAVERSSSLSSADKALELAKAVATNSENAPSVFGENQRCMSSGDDAPEDSCSRSKRKYSHELASKFHETASHNEEPQAARMPSINATNPREQADAGSKDVSDAQTSSFAQVTEEQNIDTNSSILTQHSVQLQHCDPTCQNAVHTPVGNTCSVRSRIDSLGASNHQRQATDQTMRSSMVEQYMPESRLPSDPTTIELSQLLLPLSDHSSSFAQVTERRNDNANSSSLTQHVAQQLYCHQVCQTAYQYQPSSSTCSVRTGSDSPPASNVQRPSASQTTAGTVEHMFESGPQADPFMVELNRLLMLHDLMTKRHLSKRQKIILDYEMEMAETRRKYDEQIHNLEMETLQKKKGIQALEDKVCKQQMLAEVLQVLHKPSAGNVSCSQKGAQRVSQFPASATMYQSPQPAAHPSTNNFQTWPGMPTQQATANTSDRSGATLTHAPSGVMGTEILFNAPAPHFRAFANSLPVSHRGVASLEN